MIVSPYLLGDRGGEWCAICLGYERTKAPLVPLGLTTLKGTTRRALPSSVSPADLPFSDVHAHRDCLEGSPVFRLIHENLVRYLGSAGKMTREQLDTAARVFHEQGLYSLSNVFKDALFRKSSRTERTPQLVERKIASLAGVRDDAKHPPLSDRQLRMHRDHPGIFLQQANWHVNFAQRAEADKLLRHVEDLRRGMASSERKKIDASYRMRVAQIRRSTSAARTAIDAALEDPYMLNTAYVLNGHVLAPDQPVRARTFFESIIAQGQQASWLYRAESLLGIACMMLRARDDPHEAYKYLAAASYIIATLRLQGTPHPGAKIIKDEFAVGA
jgi:hypothetical protein